MQAKPTTKYEMKDLHQEIDLFDRKISYCQNHEKFKSETERGAALQKLENKRGTLVKTALDAAARGIEFDPKFLPRSFRAPTETGGA